MAIHGDVLPLETIRQGLHFEGARVPMVGPRGIFKPAVLDELPLSITTANDGPYDDGAQVHDDDGRRACVTASVRVRLHQRTFRERVLRAYHDQPDPARLAERHERFKSVA